MVNVLKITFFTWFTLQAENQQEYVIEAHDTDDMKSWLATIKYCMRSTTQPLLEHPEMR